MDAKREVFAKLDRLTKPECILASNTSSLSVTEMAKATQRPDRVVGLHFFNPVPKMPLVEVVRGEQSGDEALATAAALSAKIGKTAIIVKDAPGFLVNRVLIPYLAEALVMATEGASIEAIDEALKDWGMPMGPFELLDEIGLDIGWHVLRSLSGQTQDRVVVPPGMDKAMEKGWLGKKSGKGFYVHAKKSKKAKEQKLVLHEEMAALVRGNNSNAAQPDKESIQWRLVLPMVNEMARLLEAGVVDSTDVVDLATVLGLGLAPFRGGLARYADSVGTDKLAAKLEELAGKHGPRFAPAPLLKRLAEQHRWLSEFNAPAAAAPAKAINHPVPQTV
jgi:3-hydroxyacyl-CoA dehydrogenase/enoyl-CoA hydratase/3-hydroxybutyryl-CoA epimerase